MKKIKSLEGIQGIACIGIVISQFMNAFLPHAEGGLVNPPFEFFLTGDTFVRILFILSGLVISYQFYSNITPEIIVQTIMKSWLKMAPVILFANIMIYVMMKFKFVYIVEAGRLSGATDFLKIYNDFQPDFLTCIKEAIFTCFIQGENAYIMPLWVVQYVFLGNILVLVALYIGQNNIVFKWIFYFVVIFGYSSYYNYFVIGMIICDLYINSNIVNIIKKKQFLNALLFVFSGYMVCAININDSIKATRIVWGIAVSVMFITLLNAKWSEKIFGNKIFSVLGKLSGCIYVVYWIVFVSLSSKIYILLNEKMSHIPICAFQINLLISFAVILFVAVILNKCIESVGCEIAKNETINIKKKDKK